MRDIQYRLNYYLCCNASVSSLVTNFKYFQALELNPSDQNALVARSKCYLLLGDPARGLEVSNFNF